MRETRLSSDPWPVSMVLCREHLSQHLDLDPGRLITNSSCRRGWIRTHTVLHIRESMFSASLGLPRAPGSLPARAFKAAMAVGLYLPGLQQSQTLRTLPCNFPLQTCQSNLFCWQYFLELTFPHLGAVFLSTIHTFDLLTKSLSIKNVWGPGVGGSWMAILALKLNYW